MTIIHRTLVLAAYAACMPAANLMIGHVGATCIPDGPCLIPVGFGLMAPSGVLLIGAALVLRDMVQNTFGTAMAIAAIAVGALLSFLTADPFLALASTLAFVVAEALDMAVYTPLRRRNMALAVLASGAAGAVADSLLFGRLAFGSLSFSAGLILAKGYASAVAAAWFWWRK